MPTASPATIQTLLTASRFNRALRSSLSTDFLGIEYRNYLYGGWRQRDRWVTKRHEGLIEFHEACKALFCPACKRCGKHYRDGHCTDGDPHRICWRAVGSAPQKSEAPWNGEGEDAIRCCDLHGAWAWRRCMMYTTIALFPGNKWAKTAGTMAELCSWPLGYRPWDGTLTAPAGSGRIWLILCQTFASSAVLTIQPLIEKYLHGRLKRLHTSSNMISGWLIVDGPGTGDIIKIVSQDQHIRTAATVSPLEGVNPAGIAVDEPISAEMRAAYGRGLIAGMSDYGWGRELMGMTFLEGTAEARAFCFNEIYGRAGNRGGDLKEVYARSGSIHENPANTAEDIRKHLEKFPIWERESRENGIYETLKGRILAEFDMKTHVFDDDRNDVLTALDGSPSSWPCYMAVDPHDTRPWVFVVVAVDPHGDWWIVREWPRGRMEHMTHYSHAEKGFGGGYKDYASVIQALIDSIPGGRSRFLGWFMDPGFGNSEKAGQGEKVREVMQNDFGFFFETKIPREIEAGHHALRQLLRGSMEPGKPISDMARPHFHVAKSCDDTIWALLNYVTKDHKPGRTTDTPAETGKDRIDVLRYLAMSLQVCYANWLEIDKSYEAARARVIQRRRTIRW